MKKKHVQDQNKKKEDVQDDDPWSKIEALINTDLIGTKDTTRMKNCILSKIKGGQ